MTYKQPRSIQVVIFSLRQARREVLLLKRLASHGGFWQFVTGSLEADETHRQAAVREVFEETGILCREDELIDLQLTNVFAIAPLWRARFAPGVTHNEEVCFALPVEPGAVRLDTREHQAYCWCEVAEATALLYWESSQKALAKLLQREAADEA
ncbi:MAG: dihydroneopterin triphosphate diphosphatase [Acidobacteria bacterium]|nr:dihydroneopterin triphosphate diphosphatase [Acidobacteriota bacterium]